MLGEKKNSGNLLKKVLAYGQIENFRWLELKKKALMH